MNEKHPTMQSEDADEAVSCTETTALSEKMTFTKGHEFISCSDIKPEAQDDLNDSLKFDGINLEDDIEKVEVTSQESLETDYKSPEAPFKETVPTSIFPEIPEQNPTESIKHWLQRITEGPNGIQKKMTTTTNQPSRVVKYQDLPYMGEMTLDNSKPRRGRKPKKADICHLIYKNYGTIFPGTPNPGSYVDKESHKKSLVDSTESQQDNLNRSDVQNRIISSLLEKRLTQEFKRVNHHKSGRDTSTKDNQNEPLNLCIRDLNHLKIRLLKNDDNTYTSEIKSEPQSDDDIEIIQETPSPSSSSTRNELRFPSVTPDNASTPSPEIPKTPENASVPGGYVYWPTAGVFIHPMALQQHLMMYQRLTGGNTYTLPSHSPRPPPDAKPEATNELRKLVPKAVRPRKSNTPQDETETHPQDTKAKRNAPSTSSSEKLPAKRKRSAIFIPPIPTENNANPATEVSICKFKFTGGAKPSLQEKKMLSVDSGGNFRYYSGTGDKSMRGYEFFPRETLQQQISNTQGSSTGAFLQASGEKIYPVPPMDITGSKSSSDFLLTPEIPNSSLISVQDAGSRHKKRKSRKSLQREKLEQTFKEKGFLIQTQQLESAEGATYCKFRQLRKFTRYLFRSWKDYLPGNVRELQEGERAEGAEAVESPDNTTDSLSVNSSDMPPPSSSVVPLPL